jgi:hypothetical protein
VRKDDEQADRQRRISNASDDERLLRRRAVLGVPIPETDQQVTAEADAFPSHIEKKQIVGEDQGHHGGHKQIHVGKESAVSLIAGHITRGIEVNEKADAGYDEQHQ